MQKKYVVRLSDEERGTLREVVELEIADTVSYETVRRTLKNTV